LPADINMRIPICPVISKKKKVFFLSISLTWTIVAIILIWFSTTL